MAHDIRANFIERKHCIACGNENLTGLANGSFDQGSVERFIAEDPWGEHPAPFLQGKPWALVECQSCHQMFHRYILDAEWNERRFSRWMSHEAIQQFESIHKPPGYDFRAGTSLTSHVLQIEHLTRGLRGNSPVKVLDFGCGYGQFLAMCSLYGFDACGVDRATAKLENNRFARVFPEISDARSYAPFHVITLFEVLEHLDDPAEILADLSGLLMTGGLLVLETPDCTGVKDISSRDDYLRAHPLEHINAFTPQTLRAMAERHGFLPIKKPVSIVAGDAKRLAKSAVKRALSRLLKPTTQMYFRKLA
jgi:2-polyprenyl-3-methyl-5-hydroxy-6-metoxy-1,4-benzoquinol methylase